MNHATIEQLHTYLATAHELLGGDHSHMFDDDAEIAHQLVGKVLGELKLALSYVERAHLKAVAQ